MLSCQNCTFYFMFSYKKIMLNIWFKKDLPTQWYYFASIQLNIKISHFLSIKSWHFPHSKPLFLYVCYWFLQYNIINRKLGNTQITSTLFQNLNSTNFIWVQITILKYEKTQHDESSLMILMTSDPANNFGLSCILLQSRAEQSRVVNLE